MAKTFTELRSLTDDLFEKREKLLQKAAGEIAETVINRMKDGKPAVANDINATLKNLSAEDKVTVLTDTIELMAMNLAQNVSSRTGNKSNNGGNSRRGADIFSGRY